MPNRFRLAHIDSRKPFTAIGLHRSRHSQRIEDTPYGVGLFRSEVSKWTSVLQLLFSRVDRAFEQHNQALHLSV